MAVCLMLAGLLGSLSRSGLLGAFTGLVFFAWISRRHLTARRAGLAVVGMAGLLAARRSPVIVMHNRDSVDPGIDIMKDIAAFFARSLDIAAKAGVSPGKIVLDPGIGFGKTAEQSMIALARLSELQSFGLPLLVGASRKRFISTVTASEPQERLGGSIAAHLIAAQAGARIIRTHDVSETVQSLRVAAAIKEFGKPK